MIGRILGGLATIGLLFLFAHYFNLEKLSGWELYLAWSLIIIPILTGVYIYFKKGDLI